MFLRLSSELSVSLSVHLSNPDSIRMNKFICLATVCLLVEWSQSLPTGSDNPGLEGGPDNPGLEESGPHTSRRAATFPVKGEGLWEAEDDNNATGGRQGEGDNNATGGRQGEGESTSDQESSKTRRQAIVVDMRSSGVVPVVYLQRSSSSSTGSDSRSQGQQQQQVGRSQGQQQQQQGQAAGRSQGQQQAAGRSQGQQQQQQAGSYMSQGLLRPSGGFGTNYPRSGIGGYPTYPSGSVTLGDYAGTGRSTAGTYMGFG
jgi:hypothetical protein